MCTKLMFLSISMLLSSLGMAQTNLLDSVLKKSTYVVKLENGKLTGSGADFIVQVAKNCQFVAIGEEHNTFDIPSFTTGLFSLLQETNDFQYLALEQDPLRSRIISQRGYRGNRDTAFNLLKRFPLSYTFASDQEVDMMTDVSGFSRGKGRPVWGCDQAFGIMHYLNELRPYARSREAQEFLGGYMDSVWKHENDRNNALHFMYQVCKREELVRLRTLIQPKKGSYADWLLYTIELSQRVYENHARGMRGIAGGFYDNGYEREEYMKERFLEEYNLALKKDGKLPKAILKFGHWHVMNGLGPSRLETNGSFVRALAKTNGMQSFYIGTSWFDHPDSLAKRTNSVLSLFAPYCKANEWTIIDLRPLRRAAVLIQSQKIIPDAALLQKFLEYIYANDAALIFGRVKRGTYEWKKEKTD